MYDVDVGSTVVVRIASYGLLLSEWPKLHRVLVILSALGLIQVHVCPYHVSSTYMYVCYYPISPYQKPNFPDLFFFPYTFVD